MFPETDLLCKIVCVLLGTDGSGGETADGGWREENSNWWFHPPCYFY